MKALPSQSCRTLPHREVPPLAVKSAIFFHQKAIISFVWFKNITEGTVKTYHGIYALNKHLVNLYFTLEEWNF